MSDEGGDEVCWLERICEHCGAMIEELPHRCRMPASSPPLDPPPSSDETSS